MKLYVIRHAIALDAAEGMRDEERPLTDEGRERFADGVRGLERLDVRFDLVLHSPLLRAAETAELLVPLLDDDGGTLVTAELAQAPTPALLELLTAAEVAVVGHEPWLSELIAWLVTQRRELATGFELKKGAVAVLEGEPRPGGMALLAFYPPGALRELGD
jgi:phosphohistidine phosphatase